MKRNVLFLISVILLLLCSAPLLASDHAGCAAHGKKGEAACAGHAHKGAGDGCCAIAGATMTVANVEKGVTVTLAGETPEAVAAIQTHAAQCAKRECCAKKDDKAGCCGKCPCMAKDVVIQVANTDKGAVVTITSDVAETAAAIQKCMAECHGEKAKAHAAGCACDKCKTAAACSPECAKSCGAACPKATAAKEVK